MNNAQLNNTVVVMPNADLPQVFTDREAWLHEAADMLLDDVIMQHTLRDKPPIRISCGFPRGSRGGKTLGVCHARSVSGDGVNEIFVSPIISEPFEVLEVLAHELIHAVDDCLNGHRHLFAKVARKIGLEGPLTATHAGDALVDELVSVIAVLGRYPHAAMKPKKAKPGQTRQLKCQCTTCNLIVRMSAAAIDQIRSHPESIGDNGACPCCDNRSLELNV